MFWSVRIWTFLAQKCLNLRLITDDMMINILYVIESEHEHDFVVLFHSV